MIPHIIHVHVHYYRGFRWFKRPHSPKGDDVHDVLRCVECDSDVPPLLQLNTAVQTGGAPQLKDPVHCSLTQGTVNTHPSWQCHVGAENTKTNYTQSVTKSCSPCYTWWYGNTWVWCIQSGRSETYPCSWRCPSDAEKGGRSCWCPVWQANRKVRVRAAPPSSAPPCGSTGPHDPGWRRGREGEWEKIRVWIQKWDWVNRQFRDSDNKRHRTLSSLTASPATLSDSRLIRS